MTRLSGADVVPCDLSVILTSWVPAGKVSLVTDKHPPHRSYALKILDKEHIKRERKTKYVLIERDTLKMLDGHPGIVRLYWTFQDQRSLCK